MVTARGRPLSTAKHQTYIEIQGGPIGDQSIKLEMQPKEKRWHVEYWFPTDRELDIYKLTVPTIQLRPINEIPLFSWARKQDVQDWESLINISRASKMMNLPAPDIYKSKWAPSGMENLDEPFKLAIKNSTGENQDKWKFYYGTWLAGRDRTDDDKNSFVNRKWSCKSFAREIVEGKGRYGRC